MGQLLALGAVKRHMFDFRFDSPLVGQNHFAKEKYNMDVEKAFADQLLNQYQYCL
jgi:hypothetical protein